MKNSLSGMMIAFVISGAWCVKALACTDAYGMHAPAIEKKNPAAPAQYSKNAANIRAKTGNTAIYLDVKENMPMLSLLDIARLVSALPSR